MNLNEALQRFGDLLDSRLKRCVFTTEDSARYTFFAALLDVGVRPHEVILEYPHPAIDRAQVDTWLPEFGSSGLAVEFKYDRAIPSGRNSPRTQKAGKLFHDLYRLGLMAHQCHCLFVYLTCSEMSRYFANGSNNLLDFYNLSVGSCLQIDSEYMSGRPITFLRSAGGSPSVTITCQLSRDLAGNHALRAYEVGVSAS